MTLPACRMTLPAYSEVSTNYFTNLVTFSFAFLENSIVENLSEDFILFEDTNVTF